MIAVAIEVGITTVMENHLYRFNNNVYLQQEGGPIGLELTGAIARVYMLWWDNQLKIKIGNAGLEWQMYFYMRYVDDANIVGEIMEPGIRYENDKLVKKQRHVEEDRAIPDDIRTAKVLQAIANSICDFVQVEIDCGSMHKNGLLPILDLEVQVRENMIIYQFYRKEMANFKVIMANSAMPYKMRKVCLIQEVVRILRNTSRRMNVSVKNKFLSEFSLRMKISGYSEKISKIQ